MKRTVMVCGRPIEVEVFPASKSVWTAFGYYMDKPLQMQDRSAGAALERWVEAAKVRGDA
jgi:hypothetical protein